MGRSHGVDICVPSAFYELFQVSETNVCFGFVYVISSPYHNHSIFFPQGTYLIIYQVCDDIESCPRNYCTSNLEVFSQATPCFSHHTSGMAVAYDNYFLSFFFNFAHHFLKLPVGVTLLVVLRLWDASITSCRLASGAYLFMMTGIDCSCCLISTSPLPHLRGDFFVLLGLIFINSSSMQLFWLHIVVDDDSSSLCRILTIAQTETSSSRASFSWDS